MLLMWNVSGVMLLIVSLVAGGRCTYVQYDSKRMNYLASQITLHFETS